MLGDLKRRLLFWRKARRHLEDLSAEQLRHIIAESDYISAAVDATDGLLKPEDMERVKALTRMLKEINDNHR